jgi:hypothetical protein
MEHSLFKSKSKSRRASFLLAATALATSLLPSTALAGTAQIVDVEQGATPFLAFAGAFYSGGAISSVSFSIQPLSGSVTRPLGATYSANYLNAHNYFIPGANAVIIPIFGLYAGTTNTIRLTYTFTDGTTNTQTTTLKTPTYTEPCAAVANRSSYNARPNTASLTYDYFLLKDYCSTNSPAILDTDNNMRWVGTAGFGSQDTGYFNNAFYATNGTKVARIDITNGSVTQLLDLATAVTAVTVTGTHHQIDPGKTGLIVDVNTTAETEATAVEFNPTTGAIINTWDFGAIISAAMSAGGDSSTTIGNFIQSPSSANADWFHNNAVAYNPADNTLIVSSRENFVMAIDYDAPTNGSQRKIHWILGDTSKAWYNTPAQSLKKYTLALGSNTLPPVGQHAVSIDHLGNVLLFDDGLGSITGSNVPAGITRNYSAARSYQLTPTPTATTVPTTATEVLNYTASAGQNLFSPICGSVYDVAGNYLVDFATTNQAAAAATPASSASTVAGNNAIIDNYLLAPSNNQTSVIIVGVGSASSIQFISAIGSAAGPCTPGWNALPFSTNVFTF